MQPHYTDNAMTIMVFFNVGWMSNYRGIFGDKIHGGGSFVKEKGFGHEIFNYLPENGNMYGYVQPVLPHNTINIERLGSENNSDSVKDILIVWTSNSPKGGTYIIGWYDNATVYRRKQRPNQNTNRIHNGEVFKFFAKAKATDCFLLPIDARTFEIPRGKGGMGQSNVWYADQGEHDDFKNQVRSFIQSQNENRIRKPINTPLKQLVEKNAIDATFNFYEQLGYEVVSVENENVGWDLEARLKSTLLYIEVKGLSANSINIQLTPNEYSNMKQHIENYRLSILTNALTEDSVLSIFSFSNELGGWVDNNGNTLKKEEIISAKFFM